MARTVSSEKKVRIKKATIITLSIVAAVGIFGGVIGGYYFHSVFGATAVTDYDAINAEVLYDDQDALMKRYEAADPSSYKEEFEPYEMADIACNLFVSSDSFFSQGKGVAEAAGGLANQEIRSTFIHSGESYFEESLSHSQFVDLADRMYQEGEKTLRYHGSTGESVEVGVYDADACVTYENKEDYAEKYGRNVSDVFNYIISSKTTLMDTTNSGSTTGVAQNDDGTYTVDLELTPDTAVVHYATQMQAISNLKYKPSFTYVHLTFELNADLTLISMLSHEYYQATTSAGLGSKIEGTLRVEYATGGDYAIPDLNTPIEYRAGE
jgi:hypothetical protein